MARTAPAGGPGEPATDAGDARPPDPRSPADAPPSLERRLEILRASPEFRERWYRRHHPDVRRTGMDTAEHYLLYGAWLGRPPSPGFDPRAYLEANPDAAASGLEAVIHYELHGRAEGRLRRPPRGLRAEMRRVSRARARLLGLGLTEAPLAELEALADASPEPLARAAASRELALWRLRGRDEAGALAALEHAGRARRARPPLGMRRHLAVVELLARHRLGRRAEARAGFEGAALCGEVGADALLARANLEEAVGARCGWINRALATHGLAPVALRAEAAPGRPAYDRLAPAAPPPPARGGPRVSVLMAAYAAERVIGTALRSLREQSWRELEILVIDDASPDATGAAVRAAAAADPRVRLIRMERNGGAYVARNRALEEATGEYLTLHDADDWSHPAKIEMQVRHLEAHPEVVACTSEQARATPELGFTRWTGRGVFVIRNVSSLMVRRAPLMERLGGWDTVRFAADSELVRRLGLAFGTRAVADLATGPVSFQRDSETSIVADEVMGMNGFYFGVRKEYHDAQRHHHASGAPLRYDRDPAARPFPVPPMMRPDRAERLARPRRLDRVMAGDFREPGPALDAALDAARAARAGGPSLGVVELHDPALASEAKRVHEALRAEVDGEAVQMLVFGEEAACGALVFPAGRPRRIDQRYLPRIAADDGARLG